MRIAISDLNNQHTLTYYACSEVNDQDTQKIQNAEAGIEQPHVCVLLCMYSKCVAIAKTFSATDCKP